MVKLAVVEQAILAVERRMTISTAIYFKSFSQLLITLFKPIEYSHW
jgi:hypothetical protein